jgi:L-threonine kinase
MLKLGLVKQDAALVAKAASFSAEIQRKIMPRDDWDIIAEIGKTSGSIGTAVAHSGTASGLLYDTSNRFGADLAEKMLKDVFSDSSALKATIRRTSVAGGGFFTEKTTRNR